MSTERRNRWTAAALLAGALTAGCSSGEAPPPLPVPAATTSPTAAAEPAALPSPVLSGVVGEVERAALGYFAALNQAFATGDTAATQPPSRRAAGPAPPSRSG